MNKIETKEALSAEIKKQKNDLSKSVIDYLDSLVNLESYIISSNCNEVLRTDLLQNDLYREIAVYNIHNQLKSIIKRNMLENVVLDENMGLQLYVDFGEKKSIVMSHLFYCYPYRT